MWVEPAAAWQNLSKQRDVCCADTHTTHSFCYGLCRSAGRAQLEVTVQNKMLPSTGWKLVACTTNQQHLHYFMNVEYRHAFQPRANFSAFGVEQCSPV